MLAFRRAPQGIHHALGGGDENVYSGDLHDRNCT